MLVLLGGCSIIEYSTTNIDVLSKYWSVYLDRCYFYVIEIYWPSHEYPAISCFDAIRELRKDRSMTDTEILQLVNQ